MDDYGTEDFDDNIMDKKIMEDIRLGVNMHSGD